ncbi:MAG: P-II family nitrogen regulator, partial [Acidiferrobacterales bacterium]
ILKAARDVGATTGAVAYYAKGIGARERLGLLGLAVEAEKAVISLLVSSEQQDVVLDHIYRAAKLDTPGMGYVYITTLEKVATYIPESMRERLEKDKASVG